MSVRFLSLAFLLAGPAAAENLYNGQNWSALAADRKAELVGDIITILVFENDTASNSVTKGSKRRTTADGNIIAGSSFNKSAGVNFGGSYNGE